MDMSWNKTGNWRYLRPWYQKRKAPCTAACPAGIDISEVLRLAGEERFLEALKLILQVNPLPGVTGRVCAHPCELGCHREKFDRAVFISAVERFLADRGLNHKPRVAGDELRVEKLEAQGPRPKTQPKVAIVGSGPAGLSCAYHLALRGYQPRVFEALPQPGGLLRYAIPAYRLPRQVLDQEIDRIRGWGVEIELNTKIGAELKVEDLGEYGAIFLACGAGESLPLNIPGEELEGVMPGLKFLQGVNQKKQVGTQPPVRVVGGGNTAIDCARLTLRMGLSTTIIYRRAREDMPAIAEEVEEFIREGGELRELTSPIRIYGEEGRVSALECIRMEPGELDDTGRPRPVPVAGSNFLVEVGTILVAIGEGIEGAVVQGGIRIEGGGVVVDSQGLTSRVGVFAGGDLTPGPRTVARAIGDGRRAALSIDKFLRGSKEKTGEEDTGEALDFTALNLYYFTRRERARMPRLTLEGRRGNFEEVNQGLSLDAALEDARRCFNCGTCNSCDNCVRFCPDFSISKGEDIYPVKDQRSYGAYIIDYDYCKGCGICGRECPRGFITMVEEGIAR